MGKKIKFEDLGNQYGKPDMERLGLFSEMPYMNGKGYVSPFPKPPQDKGRNIMCEGRKLKNGTQHGYFESEFRRIFEGEALSSEYKEKKDKKKAKPVSTRPFMPAGVTKWHSTPGDYHGTFSGNVEAFGNELRPKPPFEKLKPNCVTNPGKMGGPGYPNICLSKYPEHKPDVYGATLKVKEYGQILGGPLLTVHFPQPFFEGNPYPASDGKVGPTYVKPKEKPYTLIGDGRFIPTGPAKWQGGCHAGCFENFPEYKTDRGGPKPKDKDKSKVVGGKEFYPHSMALKTLNTMSVLQENVDFRVNVTNYKSYEPNYIKRLVD